MDPILFGVEAEFAAFSEAGDSVEVVASGLHKTICETNPYLPDPITGIFTLGGGRVYTDRNDHPEIASPETTSPYDLVAAHQAGVRVLAEALKQCRKQERAWHLLKNNWDYRTGATYGFHESYLLIRGTTAAELAPYLIPFFVSRTIFCGSGKLSSHAESCGYALSQRAECICSAVGLGTNENSMKCVVNTREESHAKGYGRHHVIHADSPMCQFQLWLTVGTTALVIRMAEMGFLKPREIPRLDHPVQAMHMFSRRPGCRAEGRSALDIQKYYVKAAAAFVKAYSGDLPTWAPLVVKRWDQVLSAIENAPTSLLGLDYWVKKGLLERRLDKHGLSWAQVRDWSSFYDLVASCESGWDIMDLVRAYPKSQTKDLLRDLMPCDEWRMAEGICQKRKLRWSEFCRMAEIIAQLREIDLKYHDISEQGLFNQLDRAGVLRHRVVKEQDIRRAITEPPQGTRAWLRSMLIRKHLEDRSVTVDWTKVVRKTGDFETVLADLSDPFRMP